MLNMKNRYVKKAFDSLKSCAVQLVLLGGVLLISGCSSDVNFMETQRIEADGIVRMDISPNSMVLNADGKSELSFRVRCFYKVDTVEVQLL